MTASPEALAALAALAAEKPPVVALIAAVATSTPPIGKDDVHGSGTQGFKYRGIERIMQEVGPRLSAAGVIVVPEVLDRHLEDRTTGTGSSWRLVTLRIRYTFHGPAGDSVSATTVGEGYDPSDKAAAKAMTTAFKYAILQVLGIADGEDVEEDAGPEAVAASRRVDPRPPPAERVRPLANVHGAQHAARVANLIEIMDAWPAADRGPLKTAFATTFGDPTELTPETVAGAEVWVGDQSREVEGG